MLLQYSLNSNFDHNKGLCHSLSIIQNSQTIETYRKSYQNIKIVFEVRKYASLDVNGSYDFY